MTNHWIHSQGPSEQKPTKNFGEEERGRIQGLPRFFWVPPIISGSDKATNFKLCTHILSIDRNKSPLQISGKVAGCVVRTLETFQGTHIFRASRGRLCDSSAVLLHLPLCRWLLFCLQLLLHVKRLQVFSGRWMLWGLRDHQQRINVRGAFRRLLLTRALLLPPASKLQRRRLSQKLYLLPASFGGLRQRYLLQYRRILYRWLLLLYAV